MNNDIKESNPLNHSNRSPQNSVSFWLSFGSSAHYWRINNMWGALAHCSLVSSTLRWSSVRVELGTLTSLLVLGRWYSLLLKWCFGQLRLRTRRPNWFGVFCLLKKYSAKAKTLKKGLHPVEIEGFIGVGPDVSVADDFYILFTRVDITVWRW